MAELRIYTGEGAQDSGGFGHPVSKATLTYILDETIDEDEEEGDKNQGDFPTVDDIPAAILDMIGYTSTNVGDGRIDRQVPRRHPRKGFGKLYAASVTNIRPAPNSLHEPEEDANDTDSDITSSGLAQYRQFLMDVEFLPRPYDMLPNNKVKTYEITWYDLDGTQHTTMVANEWRRWVDYYTVDREDILTATVGTGSKFKSTDPMNNVPFNAQTSVWLPNSTLKLKWADVPYRFVSSSNSFIRSLKGKINQSAFLDWSEGELLYMNYTFTRFDKPIPIDEEDELQGANNSAKLCDLELTFIVADGRVGTALPAQPANKNVVMAGHNLGLDLLSKRYRLVVGNDEDETPTYYSAPYELIFSDPDAVILE